jgi:voltage-gated potassium channel Kch
VGYGDVFPISDIEKVLAIFIMLGGVGFFSYVMSSFIDIIQTFNPELGATTEEKFELHNWMTLLTRFRENKPLPNLIYR